MNTTPAAPTDEGPRTDPQAGEPVDSFGPRVTRDELRDLGRMRRTRGNRKIAGVAGGLARHFDIDPIIPRVSLVVLAFFGGAGLLLYVVCWLIVPYDDTDEATVRLDPRSRTVALMIVAGLAALALIGDSVGGWGFPWPLAIIGAVVLAVMLFRGRNDDQPPPAPTGPGAPTWSSADPAPQTPYERARRARRPGPVLFWYALSIIAIGIGVMGMIELAGAPIADSAYPAFALGTCGVMLLVGAFWGRAGGIILLGLVSVLATAGATAATEIDTGHINATPLSAADVQSDYRLDAGEIELDLTQVGDLEELDGRTVTLGTDLGRVAVVLPRGLDVTITYNVDVGHRSVLGDESNGDSGTTELDGGPDADVAHLTIDADVTFGDIEITQQGRN